MDQIKYQAYKFIIQIDLKSFISSLTHFTF